jgi:uncharacterized protein with PIN domain
MPTATFHFHDELNAFIAPALRHRDFEAVCAREATAKHAIEALGVPHTEVGRVMVNDEPSGFERQLHDGDRVAVYPSPPVTNAAAARLADPAPPQAGHTGHTGHTGDAGHAGHAGNGSDTANAADGTNGANGANATGAIDAVHAELPALRAPLPDDLRFIADAHLGGLAHLLRMAGFDTLYDNNFADPDIETLASQEARVVLTRDRELLKLRGIEHGCYVRALTPVEQVREVSLRLRLPQRARPFRLCLTCNAPLHRIDKQAVLHRIPPGVRERRERFTTCDICQRVFWEGSHWERMRALMDELMR